MLVSLSFSLCRQSRQLPAEARTIEENKHAAAGVTRVSLHYFQQMSGKRTIDALSDLKSFFGYWRSEHTRLTRPWPGEMRLLPAPLLTQYVDLKSRMEQEAPSKVAEFLESHNDWYITAPERMGDLYDEQDFPSASEARESIGWKTMMLPLPDGQAWKNIRLISPNLAQEMEAATNEQITKAVEEARLATWGDLIQPVQKIIDTLTKDKPKIFDSLIGNLSDIISLAPSFNLTNDAQMNEFIETAKADLATVNADDLRSDPAVRSRTVRNAHELIARFGQFGRKFA